MLDRWRERLLEEAKRLPFSIPIGKLADWMWGLVMSFLEWVGIWAWGMPSDLTPFTWVIIFLILWIVSSIGVMVFRLAWTPGVSLLGKKTRKPNTVAPAAGEERDTWFQHAVYYLVHGAWPSEGDRLIPRCGDNECTTEWEARIRASDLFREIESALDTLQQAAFDQQIATWGRKNARRVFNVLLEIVGSRLFQPIPHSHWGNYRVRPMHLAFAPEQVYTVHENRVSMGDTSFASVMVSRHQIEALYQRHGGIAQVAPASLQNLDLEWNGRNKAENIAKAIHAMMSLLEFEPSCGRAVFQLGEAYRHARAEIVGHVRSEISQSEALYLDERSLSVVTQNPRAYNADHNSLLHEVGNFTQSLRQLHRRYVDFPDDA